MPFFRHLKEITGYCSPAVFTSALAFQDPESLPGKLIDRIGRVVVGQLFSFRYVSERMDVIHCYRFHLEVADPFSEVGLAIQLAILVLQESQSPDVLIPSTLRR